MVAMGVANPMLEPQTAVKALVDALADAFDAAKDLYQTLHIKERRDYEQNLRSKGYPSSRRISYVEDEVLGCDEDFALDKAAVTQQFDVGYQQCGEQFAIGDVLSVVGLQTQLATLQKVLITILLYGPTSNDSLSEQRSKLGVASRAAGTSSVDILKAQLQRQQAQFTPSPRSSHSPTEGSYQVREPHPTAANGTASSGTYLVRYQGPIKPRSASPVNTTILEWRGRPKIARTDTDTTSMTGPTSHGTQSDSPDLYCLYAMDLERHPSQQLSASITQDPVPHCPHCDCTLHLSPGKAWEVRKYEGGYERCFQVANRFVVKCHRSGADGQYACILCTRHVDCDSVTVCGDVKALIKHVWADHSIAELKHEEDITEVVELAVDRRSDGGTAYPASRRSRRSASLGPSIWGSNPDHERERYPRWAK